MSATPTLIAPKPLLDLRAGECRYPFGDDVKEMRFCAEPVEGLSSWCSAHRAKCCVPVNLKLSAAMREGAE